MSDKTAFVSTKLSKLRKITQEEHEHVVFVSHKSKKKTSSHVIPDNIENDAPSPSTSRGFVPSYKPADIKKLQLEIRKMSTVGSSAVQEGSLNKASTKFLRAMGAKQPKRKYKNYKDMLTSRRAAAENKKRQKEAGSVKIKKKFKPVRTKPKKHLMVVGNKVRKQKSKSDIRKADKKFLNSFGRK